MSPLYPPSWGENSSHAKKSFCDFFENSIFCFTLHQVCHCICNHFYFSPKLLVKQSRISVLVFTVIYSADLGIIMKLCTSYPTTTTAELIQGKQQLSQKCSAWKDFGLQLILFLFLPSTWDFSNALDWVSKSS